MASIPEFSRQYLYRHWAFSLVAGFGGLKLTWLCQKASPPNSEGVFSQTPCHYMNSQETKEKKK
jgi:hypothetical protein